MGFTFRDRLNTAPERAWIDQPSTLQPLHKLHASNVISIPPIIENSAGGSILVYFTKGPVISAIVPVRTLSRGWVKEGK